MNKSKTITAAIVMGLAVAIGAFGAHALKPYMDDSGTQIFKTASMYHFVHGLGLFVVVNIAQQWGDSAWLQRAFGAFLTGIVIFSGSLYVLALRSAFPAIPGWLGAITPAGGFAFVIGWLSIAWNFFLKKES